MSAKFQRTGTIVLHSLSHNRIVPHPNISGACDTEAVQERMRKKSEQDSMRDGDTYTSRVGVSGLLNAEKIGLVGVILENFEKFCRHFRARTSGNLESIGAMNQSDDIMASFKPTVVGKKKKFVKFVS